MTQLKILFVCIHNSARSQMAEAFVNHSKIPFVKAQSAGIEPGLLNPLVVEVMKEIGVDISANRTKTVREFLNQKNQFDYVITVCDETSGQRCPTFPGKVKRLHWTFEDPSQLKGSPEEKLVKIRQIRDQIKNKVENWIKELK